MSDRALLYIGMACMLIAGTSLGLVLFPVIFAESVC